ncbi:tripartite tricarboxylate transporter TctB family protein [Variovorax sp. PCZ-1]|uniref:tripartite tricarboxylate transporter TctB family protein n=1 Tax=Variovorax sp. PCZ-1 TaxID=2835533 RepID=UPI001BD0F028|nr:tripartite tricarboxylate transporter TctB family protein [Variovorax sp. PCZ-1]
MNIKSQKDFFAGLMFIVVGAAFAIGAYSYSMGEGARMGPGYFPRLLGVVLAVLGSIILFKSLTVATADGDKIGSFAWKPMFCIIGANIIFGICIGGLPIIKFPALGMIVGIYALTFVASLAASPYKVKEVFLLATFLSILSYLAFIVLLNLQFPVWPSFLA